MAKANVILLNSILWNLREVTKLAEKIKQHCGDVDCTSWRYPLTSCSELEIFKLLQNNRNLDNYTYILELTYDRLLYVFNLIIKYLETAESLEKFRPSKNVQRPKTLSLASVLYMIWDRIRAQTESLSQTNGKEKLEIDESEKEEIKGSTSTTCTQSEICCISVCSCCEMAQEFITQIVLETERILDKHEIDSAISNERKIMREHLVEMNNWTAMSRWVSALMKDFNAISEKAEQATTNSRQLKNRMDSGERKMKARIDQLEEEKKKLEGFIRDREATIREKNQEIERLIKEKAHMSEEIKSNNSKLNVTISNFETKIAALKRQYECQLSKKNEKKTKKDLEKMENLHKKIESERFKRKELQSQNEELKETISKLNSDLEIFKSQLDADKITFENVCGDFERLKEENKSLNSVLIEKHKIIQDYSVRLMGAYPELNTSAKNKYKATGNPETDMENQIEANKLRMEILTSENENLRKTLEKIKSLKG